jgi:hypothetical protein
MLTPSALSTRLENEWLGQFPASSLESGDLFAGAVSSWFATAMAGGFPCATAAARRVSLTAMAAGALAAGIGPTSGMLLATAVATYYAGQLFGAGVASFPIALPAGVALITAALLDLNMPKKTRADQIAQACYGMALSTIVIFPAPLPPAPVL